MIFQKNIESKETKKRKKAINTYSPTDTTSTPNIPATLSPTICLVSVQSQPNHKSFLKYFYRTYYNTKHKES